MKEKGREQSMDTPVRTMGTVLDNYRRYQTIKLSPTDGCQHITGGVGNHSCGCTDARRCLKSERKARLHLSPVCYRYNIAPEAIR